MTSANNLSLSTRALTTGGWLVLSWLFTGCQQPPPSQLAKNSNAAAQAGAPAKGGTADKGQKMTTGQGTAKNSSMMGAAGDAAKSGGRDANMAVGNMMSGGAAGGAASNMTATAGAAAPAKANPKAIPACEGKADENVCDDMTLYHCVNGAYEGRGQACKTAAQCQAGLTTGQCGECDPGSFQCVDIELQSCDDTGAWVVAMECPSAKLCRDDMGICADQACTEGEYKCNGDQLQTCNRDFSDWEDEGQACEPGLCSAQVQGCLECMPGTPAACSDETTLTGCTMEGMLDPQPCAQETPFCTEAKCVQCNTAADCGESMNQCGTLTCNAGMCAAGDPKPKGTACSSNGGQMCDYLGTCVHCVTDLDCKDSTKRCFLQRECVTKNAITATPLLGTWSVTISPGFAADVDVSPGADATGTSDGAQLGASSAIDTTYLLGISGGYSACGFVQIASGDGNSIRLGFSKDVASGEMAPPFPSCNDAYINLTARSTM